MKSKSKIVINPLPDGFYRSFFAYGFDVFTFENDSSPRKFQTCSSLFSAVQLADTLLTSYSFQWNLHSVCVMCSGITIYSVFRLSDEPVCHV